MQIQTIQKGFEAFKSEFEMLEKDLKHSDPNLNYLKRIRSIRLQIRTSQMQIWTVQKGFEAFEFETVERVAKYSNETFSFVKKHSNANPNHSKRI